MCRCEAILYVQKMQELGDGGADVQMAHGLARACSLRIGTTRVMDSHPDDTILENYPEIKEKVSRDERKKGQGGSPARVDPDKEVGKGAHPDRMKASALPSSGSASLSDVERGLSLRMRE